MSLDNSCARAALNRRLAEGRGADDPIHQEMLKRKVRCLTTDLEGTVTTCRWIRFYGDLSTAGLTAPGLRDCELTPDQLV